MIKNQLIKIQQKKTIPKFFNNEENIQPKRNSIPKQLEWLLTRQSTTASLLLDGNQKEKKRHFHSKTQQILEIQKRQINKHCNFLIKNSISYENNTIEANNPRYLLMDIKNHAQSRRIKAGRTKTSTLVKNFEQKNSTKVQKSYFNLKLKEQKLDLNLSVEKHVIKRPTTSFNGFKQKSSNYYCKQHKNIDVQNNFSGAITTTKISLDEQIKHQISILKNTQNLIRRNRPITCGTRTSYNRKLFGSVSKKNNLTHSFNIAPWQNKTMIDDEELL